MKKTMNFQQIRAKYQPKIPETLKNIPRLQSKVIATAKSCELIGNHFTHTRSAHDVVEFSLSETATSKSEPLRVGVVLSGGQAPGGHNVIAGLYDALSSIHKDSSLIGFCNGPMGIVENKALAIDGECVDQYRNSGGFHMLGSGRTKIESAEHFAKSLETVNALDLDGLVIIGGDDSNTNAAWLAEYFAEHGSKTKVIGVPKTIDGDLKNSFVETSFGFDTAVRLYSELISNIAADILSSKKYYHFVRLMGRAASHIAAETALLTHPNMVIISEEIASKNSSLEEVSEEIVKMVVDRAKDGKNYGIIIVPEGLIEFIPDIKNLIQELNSIIGHNIDYIATLRGFTDQSEYLNHKLSKEASYTFSSLPINIQRQLIMDRDPHGNIQVSSIETEKLLVELVERRLDELKASKAFVGKFQAQTHFLGYEGRCAAPTNFDANYSYALGLNAIALLKGGFSGYMSVIQNLASDTTEWRALGVPLVAMMDMEERSGIDKPVIKKGLLDLGGPVFKKLKDYRQKWSIHDDYRYVGSIQYFGPTELCDQVPKSLTLEKKGDACT
jgi:diphosphate-dependent phosphofructokinase